MRIYDGFKNVQPKTTSAVSTDAKANKSAAESPSAAGSPDSVKVTISSKARELAGTRESFDAAKVARLKEKVESGELKIDAQAIAHKIAESGG
jgi:flagellar biosynthesis anti-sigma factor FlgM